MRIRFCNCFALLALIVHSVGFGHGNEAHDSTHSSHYLDRYDAVAIYPLDQDPNTTNLTDATGEQEVGLHRKESGVPARVEGARAFTGQAWNFKGIESSLRSRTSGGFHTLGDIENTTGISVSFWMQLPLERMQANHRLFGYPAAEAVISKIGYGGLNIRFGSGYTIGLDRHSGYQAYDGQWHHIVATADFTSKRNNVVLYLDGKEVVRTDGAANQSFNSTNPKTPFFIGARGNGGHTFDGALDDVALFNYALSSEQVKAIHAGPFYIGSAMNVYLPDHGQLDAITPPNTRVQWSKHSGPSAVVFENPKQATTNASFATPGTYELELTAEGFDTPQLLPVTVHPPTAPSVFAGDPIFLSSTNEQATLQATINIPGQQTPNLNDLEIVWKTLSGPGTVHLSQSKQAISDARFSEPGLYQLQVSATRNDLTNTDQVSVLVGESQSPHYSLLLNPLYALPLDKPPNRRIDGIPEVAEHTLAGIADLHGELPQMQDGARPFTGNAWDFSNQDTKIAVHNRFNIARIGNIHLTSGLSFSLWFKADAYNNDLGRIGGWSGVSINPDKYSEGVSVSIDGTTVSTSPKRPELANKLYTGTWHHMLASVDFTAQTDNVRLYIDGQLIDQASRTFEKDFSSDRTDKAHYWGCRENGGGYYFQGQLDDIVVFDRSLNEDEVAYLYNGPNTEQQAHLQLPQPVVDAGADQVHPLSTRKISLQANAETGTNLNYKWSLLHGPSDVSFTNPNSQQTEVTFAEPDAELHNQNYRAYTFRITARNTDGTLARAGIDQVSVVLYDNDTPKTRKLSNVPAPGIHPRVLFSPEDLPSMRKRFAADPYAQKAAAIMQADYDSKLLNPKTVIGHVYQQLKAGEPNIDVKFVVGDNDTRTYWQGNTWLYGSLAGAASIALMEENDTMLDELATVLSNAAKAHLDYYQPNYPNKLVHDASGGLALAYDFLATNMDEAQRQPVRELLSRMTQWRQSLGSATYNPRHNSSNWFTHHDQIVLAALAIEGEPGYDADLAEQATQKLRTFLTQHGIFNSGYAHEGYGYFLMGMESAALSTLALSRRGENLYETTNLYNAALMMFRSMPPGCAFISNHGDTGPRISDHTQPLNWVMRYLWPDDPAVTYLSETRLQHLLAEDADPRSQSRALQLMAVLFPIDSRQLSTQAAVANELDLPLSTLCPDKGYANMRSSWQDNAVNLVFRCQQDKYNVGHGHPDINSFELYANGTTWFLDPGKYQNYNDCHQTVLIDGRGTDGSSAVMTWPPMPGKFVEFKETADIVYSVGDAKPAYDYSAGPSRTKGVELEQIPASDADLLWADFVYGKYSSDLAAMPKWRAFNLAELLHTDGKYLYRYNPVKRAFRTAVLINGEHPYTLIIDDIQKDHAPHTYQWIGNFETGTVEVVSQTDNELILKTIGDDDIGNRLLVRVIQADGLTGKPELINTKIGNLPSDPSSAREVTQLRITADGVVAPNFKLLIYPYTEGAPLPVSKFDQDQLTIQLGAQTDTFQLSRGADGRTQINQ